MCVYILSVFYVGTNATFWPQHRAFIIEYLLSANDAVLLITSDNDLGYALTICVYSKLQSTQGIGGQD